MSRTRSIPTLALLLILGACAGDAEPPEEAPDAASGAAAGLAMDGSDALGPGRDALTPDDIERGRLDADWRAFADEERAGRGRGGPEEPVDGGVDPAGAAADTTAARTPGAASSESFDDIGAAPIDVDPAALPLGGDAEGPSVLAAQILLDRARFSPGIADGRWGKNTEKAVYWFQSERGLEPSGRIDAETLDLLRREAGVSGPLSREVTLTDAMVSGPFVTLPEDIYARAEMDCLCYESLAEQLAERFHTTPHVLRALNPGRGLDRLSAGDGIVAPDHGGPTDSLGARDPGRGGSVARIVISDGGRYLHAVAQDGRVLYHFPTTLGSEYAPSPSGDYAVNGVAHDPTWHYQPKLLTGEDPSKPDAVIPAGPNNPVGVVWIDLTEPHYGIHGTAAPETIGYATSHGCVRLTNWDAAFLASLPGVAPGTPVEFRSLSGRGGG